MLESTGQPIGIAHSVAGVRNLRVTLTGKANHSGTTPMNLRADAFAGLAAVGAAIPRIIAEELRMVRDQRRIDGNAILDQDADHLLDLWAVEVSGPEPRFAIVTVVLGSSGVSRSSATVTAISGSIPTRSTTAA